MDAESSPNASVTVSAVVATNGNHVNDSADSENASPLATTVTPNTLTAYVNGDQPPESNMRTDLKHASNEDDSYPNDVPMCDLTPSQNSASDPSTFVAHSPQTSLGQNPTQTTAADSPPASLSATLSVPVDGPDTSPDPSIPTQSVDGDAEMSNDSPPSPVASAVVVPVLPPPPQSTSTVTPPIDSPIPSANNDEDDQPPPAKRARIDSDADTASTAHSTTPMPPPSPSATPTTEAMSHAITNGNSNGTSIHAPQSPTLPGQAQFGNLSPNQFRFCQSTVRTLKKSKDAAPFLKPVDPIALNIPQYFQIVKSPMDFATVERKLSSSNPTKPDPNPLNPRYSTVDAFVADVRLIFTNCYLFNGQEHAISQMARRLNDTFDKQIKHIPPPDLPKPPPQPKPPVIKKQATPTPPAPPAPPKKVPPPRRTSTSVPVIRRSEGDNTAVRPKREIHPPPPKDLPYAEPPKKAPGRKPRASTGKDDGTQEQLKYCAKILADLHKKQHWACANPFYYPVDHVALGIPDYPKVVKRPMDMSTMKKKLENHEYPMAKKFEDDFKLMIKNCFLFNPEGTPVHTAGMELQKLFQEKWAALPPLHDGMDEDAEDEEDDDYSHQRAIADMESQIETMRSNLSQLKKQAPKEKKKEKKPPKSAQPSSSKASTKPPKAAAPSIKKKPKNKNVTDDDVLSFEQKKDLSEAIGALEPHKLERVIHIIHEGVPEIRDSTEEIELEIDVLPAPVLTKLYNFVVRPLRAPAVKRTRGGKGTGTGGLKRKSMDEDVEAEKIRLLEQRMALFQPNAGGATLASVPEGHHSEHSSDSSDDSDSSASDSE